MHFSLVYLCRKWFQTPHFPTSTSRHAMQNATFGFLCQNFKHLITIENSIIRYAIHLVETFRAFVDLL